MSDDDTISDISDGDIELSDEDMKALGFVDEEPEADPAAQDEPPPEVDEPAPSKLKKRGKPVVEEEPEPEPEEAPRPTPRREKPKSRTAAPKEDNPPPQPKPAIARRRPTKINSTWHAFKSDRGHFLSAFGSAVSSFSGRQVLLVSFFYVFYRRILL
jgi:outer membrane biosynthesis protein TonB